MWLLGTLAAVGLTGLGFAAGKLVHRPSGRPRPPLAARPRTALVATPREWLHDFSTDSLRRPALICSQLFSPAFAAVYEQARGRCRPLPRPLAGDALEAQAHPRGRVHGRARAGHG